MFVNQSQGVIFKLNVLSGRDISACSVIPNEVRLFFFGSMHAALPLLVACNRLICDGRNRSVYCCWASVG